MHHFRNYEYQPDLSGFISKLRDIAKTAYERHQIVKKELVVREMLKLQRRETVVEFRDKEFRVD